MHRMSDWDMARVLPAPPVRPFQGPGDQSRVRDRLELNLLTNLHPDKLLTPRQRRLLDEIGLDGHWLISAGCHYINRGMVNPHAPRAEFDEQMLEFLDFLSEVLFNDIIASCEADGLTDDRLHQVEFWLKEHLPELSTGLEHAIMEVYNILGNYTAPPHCKHSTIDRYFLGYSMEKDYGGVLHFYFKDPSEDHHSL